MQSVLFPISGPVLLQACGSSLPQPVLTSDRNGIVRFVSNERDQLQGFSLHYEASVEGKLDSGISIENSGILI